MLRQCGHEQNLQREEGVQVNEISTKCCVFATVYDAVC